MAQVNLENGSYYIPQEIWNEIMNKKWWLEQKSFWEKNWAVGRPVVDDSNTVPVPTIVPDRGLFHWPGPDEVLEAYEEPVVALRHARIESKYPSWLQLYPVIVPKPHYGVAEAQNGELLYCTQRDFFCMLESQMSIKPPKHLGERYMKEKYRLSPSATSSELWPPARQQT